MGMRGGWSEKFILENGVILTDRMVCYRIPTMAQTPEIVSIIVEHPTREGPHGAKGVGEIAGVPTTSAITNAIYHAVGLRVDRLPVEQEYNWKEMFKADKTNLLTDK